MTAVNILLHGSGTKLKDSLLLTGTVMGNIQDTDILKVLFQETLMILLLMGIGLVARKAN